MIERTGSRRGLVERLDLGHPSLTVGLQMMMILRDDGHQNLSEMARHAALSAVSLTVASAHHLPQTDRLG